MSKVSFKVKYSCVGVVVYHPLPTLCDCELLLESSYGSGQILARGGHDGGTVCLAINLEIMSQSKQAIKAFTASLSERQHEGGGWQRRRQGGGMESNLGGTKEKLFGDASVHSSSTRFQVYY